MHTFLRAAEELEADAARERIDYLEDHGLLASSVLDAGCGNGHSVLEMRARGMSAVGIDSSWYRLSRWLAEGRAGAFVLADASALPFPSNHFGAVISSGLLEHVGVSEQSAPYRVWSLPHKHTARAMVLVELQRVSSGAVVVDFPNGSFPIDFWHGDRLGAFRVHAMPDPLNPSLRQVRSYIPGSRLTLLPLRNRLRFRQVSRRWWGRLLAPCVRAWLRFLDLLPRHVPLLSLLYPFLVIRIEPAASNPSLQRTRFARR